MGEELYTIDLRNIGYEDGEFYTKPEIVYDAFQDSFMANIWLMRLTRVKKNQFVFYGHIVNFDLPKSLGVIKQAIVKFGYEEDNACGVLDNVEVRDEFIRHLVDIFERTLVFYAKTRITPTALKEHGGKMVINEEMKQLSRKMTIQEYYEVLKDICDNPEIVGAWKNKMFYNDYVADGCK